MADMTTIKGRIQETIYPNGTGAITAESHQALLLEMVDNINEVKQDVLVSGQNIRPLISGESLLGGDALAVLGTAFIYEYESEQVFAMMNGTREEVKPWVLNRATASQVAQSISILRQNVLQAIVPVVIKTRAESAIICWEYDGLIYEIEWENDAYKVVTTPKGNEFDKEGNYPLLHVGTADDLAGRGESVPAEFGFRASGGKSIKDGRAYIKRIKGNSVVWNQLSKNRLGFTDAWCMDSYSEMSRLSYDIDNNILTIAAKEGDTTPTVRLVLSIPTNHKVLVSFGLELETNIERTGTPYIGYFGSPTQWLSQPIDINLATNKVYQFEKILSLTSDVTHIYVGLYGGSPSTPYTAEDKVYIYSPRIIDLTKMFGAGNEPTTIEEFNARVATLGIDMNAYNEGQVIHCNTESIKSVGDNAWDEEWEIGAFSSTTGNGQATTKFFRSKNRIKILPNTDYFFSCPSSYSAYARFCFYDESGNFISYLGTSAALNKTFKTPTNATYMVFWTGDSLTTPTYNHDIMITLVHSGWKQDTDAGYQPYWQDTLPLPIIRKYFPNGMKKAGSAHDEIRFNKSSGKWEAVQKIGSVDIGTLSIISKTTTANGVEYRYFLTNDLKGIGVPPNYTEVGNAIVAPYTIVSALGLTSRELPNKSVMAYDAPGLQVYFRDDAYADAESFKAAMQGVMLYYELAEPIVTEITDSFRDYYQVADFGTEMSQSNNVPSAAFSADIIYQFNAVDMIREHELEITELQNVIATMQAQLTSLINGGQ